MKKDKMGGTCRIYEQAKKKRYIMLVSVLEGARSLSRFSIRLKDNIKTDLRGICWEDVD